MEWGPEEGRAIIRSPGRCASSFGSTPPRSTAPDAEAGEVVVALGVHARHLGRLAAGEGRAGLPAAFGDAGDHPRRLIHVQLAAGEIVQEQQRLGALGQQIVDAHGHQVDPDGVVQAGLGRHLQLGADAVGGGDEQGIVVAGRLEVEERAEAAQGPVRARPAGRLGERLDPLDESGARVDVDAGLRRRSGRWEGLVILCPRLADSGPRGRYSRAMSPITTTAELADYCRRVKGSPFIAVDTEFMRETTYWPKLCLIQAATPEHEAVIDPLAEGIDLEPFLEILRDEATLKVLHAARQDVEIFHNLKAIPRPLFDTQIAAMAAGFGEQVAYDALVRKMLKEDVDKSSRFTDWARRPLSEAQLTYALGDVTHLAKLYPMLRERLEAEGRLAWVAEEMVAMTDPALYDTAPENAWKRLRPEASDAEVPRGVQGCRCLARTHRANARPAARAHPQRRRDRGIGDPGADQPRRS